MYKLIAISKTSHGTMYYAVINEFAVVEAIVKSKDGSCFDIRFLETTPTGNERILAFVRAEEKKGQLK